MTDKAYERVREEVAQLEATLHQRYYNRKYGYHPWDKLPPVMKAEIYENADQFLSIKVGDATIGELIKEELKDE